MRVSGQPSTWFPPKGLAMQGSPVLSPSPFYEIANALEISSWTKVWKVICPVFAWSLLPVTCTCPWIQPGKVTPVWRLHHATCLQGGDRQGKGAPAGEVGRERKRERTGGVSKAVCVLVRCGPVGQERGKQRGLGSHLLQASGPVA